MLRIDSVKSPAVQGRSEKTENTSTGVSHRNSTFNHTGLNLVAQQNRAMINFTAGGTSIFRTPKGSEDKHLVKWIEQTKLGDGVPLIGFLRGEQITSTPKVKETIQQALNDTPKRRGGVIGDFQEALEVIEEKLGKK